jgi:hypothetical protein
MLCPPWPAAGFAPLTATRGIDSTPPIPHFHFRRNAEAEVLALQGRRQGLHCRACCASARKPQLHDLRALQVCAEYKGYSDQQSFIERPGWRRISRILEEGTACGLMFSRAST